MAPDDTSALGQKRTCAKLSDPILRLNPLWQEMHMLGGNGQADLLAGVGW